MGGHDAAAGDALLRREGRASSALRRGVGVRAGRAMRACLAAADAVERARWIA